MSQFVIYVLPVFNRKLIVQETIKSILNQSYKYFELIIVDDCSTDGTYESLKKIYKNNRVKVFKTKKTLGHAHTQEM